MAATAVPFSYAQAAKSKPTTTLTTATSSKGKAHDGLDESTTVESSNEVQQQPPEDLDSSLSTSKSEIALEPPVNPLDNTISSTLDSSASSTTMKDDDANSDSRASEDHPWDAQAAPKIPEWRVKNNEDDGSPSQEEEKEKSTIRPLVDAPPPAVNFWQQRAQAAQSKQEPSSKQPRSISLDASSARAKDIEAFTTSGNVAMRSMSSGESSTSHQAKSPGNRQRDPVNRASFGPKGNPGSSMSKPVKSGIAPPATAPPSVQDEGSWPTPNHALDDDRKRSVDKSEKTEKDRLPTSGPKSHGKNGWVPMPINPTVKFNTPLPSLPKRGGRHASRGGREPTSRKEALSTVAPRSDAAPAVATGVEEEQQGRRSSGATSPKSMSKLVTDFGTSSQAEDLATTDLPSVALKSPDPTAQAVVAAENPGIIAYHTLRNGRGGFNKTGQRRNGPAIAIEPTSSVIPTTFTPEISLDPDQRLTSVPGNETREPSGSNRPKTRNPRPVNGSVTHDGDLNEKRRSTTDGNTFEFGQSVSESKFDDLPQIASNPRQSWSGPYRERNESRVERGKPKGRGGHNVHGSFYTNNHQNLTTWPPPVQTYPVQISKNASSYSQPQSNSRPHPTSDQRPWRQGPPTPLPNEAVHGRYSNGFVNASPTSAISPYSNGPYENPSFLPFSLVPYSPYMDPSMLVNTIVQQLTYYFSLDNLIKDTFLRSHMDSQGFVPLELIANFKRMKELTPDLEFVKFAAAQTPELELRSTTDNKDKIRKREGWDKWVLQMSDRVAAARNDGPSPVETQRNHHQQIPYDLSSPISPYRSSQPPSYGFSVGTPSQYLHQKAPTFVPVAVSGQTNRPVSPEQPSNSRTPEPVVDTPAERQPTPSIVHNGTVAGMQEVSDSFPDEQIESLTVFVRPKLEASGQNVFPRNEGSRTFSDGSIDFNDLRTSEERPSRSLSRQNGLEQEDESTVATDLRSSFPSKSRSPSSATNTTSSDTVGVFWVKEKDSLAPVPFDSTCELYTDLRMKGLEQRQAATFGQNSHDMDVLYQFWSHFLIRNFNARMYEEFRRLAFEDATTERSYTGISNLIKYYNKALTSQQIMRDVLAKDYIELVKTQDEKISKLGLKRLRSAWRDGSVNMKNRKKVSDLVDSELREVLDG